MKGKFSKTEMRGLPGGPNEQFTYVTGVFMQDMYHAPIAQKGGEGYRIDAPNYNDPSKIIKGKKGNPTNITMTEQDGGPLKKGPLLGIDNMGNQQMMFPGYEYQFPGDMVMEIPLRKAQLGEEPANTYMPYDKFRDSSDAYKYLAALNAAEKRRTELIKEAVVDEKGRKIIPIELQKRIAEDPILKWSTGAGGLKNVMPYEMFIDKFGEENLWKLEEEFLKNYSDDTKYYYENKLEDINNLFGDLSHPDYSVGRRGDILPSTNALYDTSKHSLYGTTLPIGEDYSEIEDKYNKELRVRKSLDEIYQQDYGKSYDEVMKPIYASGKYPKSESQKLYWNPETNTPEWHYPSENPEKLKYWEELKEKERDEFSRFIKEYRNNNGINTDVYQTLPYKPGEDNFNNSLQNLPSQDDNTTTKEKPQLYSSPRQLNISTNIRSQPRDIGIQIGKPKINKDPDPGTRAWRDMMRAKTDEEKSLWQKAKQDGGGVKFNPYARAFPINEDIKAIVGDIGMRTNFKNKPAYINTSIKPTFGYIPEGPNIFDLKGEASVGMRSGDFNTELGVSKNFMRQDDPSLIGSIGYNTEKFGINASSNIPTKKNPNFFPSVNIRYNPNENLSIFGEGQYDSISKSPSFRTGLNYRFKQKGGEDEFNRILKKYTTQGWDSLTPQEQQFYRETYQRGGSLPRYQSKGEVLTYQDNPEYFDNKAVLGDNIRYSDLVKKRVYAGTHGYNPTTGEMVKLDSPQGGAGSLTKAQSKRGARQARVYADNPLAEKPTGMSEEDIAAITHNARFKDLQSLYKNPAFLAPGIIGSLGTIGPAALANPYVQAGLTGYGVYDAITHSIPGAVKATKEGRYLDAAGNTAMASLDLLPIPFFGTNLVGEGKKLGKALTSKVNNQNFSHGIGSFPGTHNPTFYKQNLETITESEKYDRNFADLKYAQEWAKKYDYDFPKNLEDISKSDEATNKIIKDIVDKHNTFVRGVRTDFMGSEMPLETKKELIKIFKKEGIDYVNDPQAVAKYMATHIPIVNTYAGRASLANLNTKYDAIYTSNSIPTAEAYTYGDGFIVDVKKPTDFSSLNRKDWIRDNQLDYFEHALPNDDSDLAKRILKTEHISPLEDIYKNKIILSKNSFGKTNNPMAELANRQDRIIDILNRQGKFANREELVKFKQILNEDIPKLTKFKSFIKKAKTPIADLYVDGFNHKNNLKRANEALLKQQATLDKHFPDWRNIKSNIYSNPGYNTIDDKYAHYIHMGEPGEKIFDAINFKRITPENYINTDRGHHGLYSKGYSSMQTGGEFQRILKKYITKGWQSLTDQEKQTYKEMYQQYK